MAHINLLPWREVRRQQQKNEYVVVLVAVALFALALTWIASTVVDGLIDNQRQRNAFLEQHIAQLDAQIGRIKEIKEQKTQVEQRMALIEQLQTNRNVAPQVLDELANIVPPGIAFRSLSRKGNRVEVLGVSESNNRLADFMRRLETSRVFGPGELSSIVADTTKSDAVSEFKLNFSISPMVAPEILATMGVK
ncbi:PilN domain-containing protein [Aliiglaciecola sp. CAU 1673]|uniref:PilN domain-containing protein n=1 Tax=Aliiglaciecola sp. CAU 1673 TaxID=3032595 RepID=UPI0023DACEA4|nr:PilN domain-containing protein [Aliiglaciecola sp. CAU 1673]MDF2178681.1 PilN domain-containing protein [Aliiglaciecola sp. CAU 1673]